MAYCNSCGQRVEDGAKHCPVCGAAIPVAQPVYVQSVPVQAPPRISVKSRVLGFVGLGLGIEGLITSVIFLIMTAFYTLIAAVAYTEGANGIGVMPVILGFYFSIFSIPIAIVGRILCRKAIEGGNPSKVCVIGSKLNIAALIVSIVMVVLGLFGIAMI